MSELTNTAERWKPPARSCKKSADVARAQRRTRRCWRIKLGQRLVDDGLGRVERPIIGFDLVCKCDVFAHEAVRETAHPESSGSVIGLQ